jgi:O-antigen/teichoic acid export membrane protein
MMKIFLSLSGVSLARAIAQAVFSALQIYVLTPAQFSVIGLSLPVVVFVNLIGDAGVGPLLTRGRGVSAGVVAAVLRVQYTFAVILSIAVFFLLGAGVFGSYDLWTKITVLVFSVIPFFGLPASTLRAYQEGRGEFLFVARIEAIALFIGISSFVGFWFFGGEIYALLSFYISNTLARYFGFRVFGGLSWGVVPAWIDAKHELKGIFSISTFNIINFFGRNIDRYLVGVGIGSVASGLYSLSYQFLTAPLMMLTWPLSGYLTRLFSSTCLIECKDSGRLALSSSVRSASESIAIVSSIICSLCAVSVPYFVAASGRAEWREIPSLINVMLIVGCCQSVASISGAVFVALGRVRLQLLIGLANFSLVALWFGVSSLLLSLTLHEIVFGFGVVAILISVVTVLIYFRLAGVGVARAFMPFVFSVCISVAILFLYEVVISGGWRWILVPIIGGVMGALIVRTLKQRIVFLRISK